jgi:copper chaperone NosL
MKRILLIMALIVLAACSREAEPIAYGSDSCQYCKMTIVSKAHAAQQVTQKGKQYKYDAIECMLRDNLENHKDVEMAIMLVADFQEPGTMISTSNATFLIHESISSPMGENLAAIKDSSEPVDLEDPKAYSWSQLKHHFLNEGTLSHQ